MYESFFALTERPFLAVPRADRYFPGASSESARQNLARSIERAEGPGLLIGPVGTGKSMLCHVLAEQFRHAFQIAHLSSARLCTRRALLQAILYELGLPYREREEGELRLSLIDYLAPGPNAGSGMLLLIDEAHALPLRLLEEVRMITNLVRNGQPRVRLVLAGSPSLEERFANPKLESFNQRIAVRCYLEPLNIHETTEYVRAQIAACGGEPDQIFADDAFGAIHRATDGVPRLINHVCDHALVLAGASKVRQIDAAGIEEAWADLQQLPLPFSGGTPAADPRRVIEFGSLDDDQPLDDHAPIDDDVEAVPFPIACSSPAAIDPIGRFLPDLDDEFEPAGVIGRSVELVGSNPFSEAFEEEEVVIDRYASLDEVMLRGRPRVTNRGSNPWSATILTPASAPSISAITNTPVPFPIEPPISYDPAMDYDPVMPEELAALGLELDLDSGLIEACDAEYDEEGLDLEPATPVGAPGDEDLIIVEDPLPPAVPPPAKVRRQEYRKLFAQLRGN